MKSVPESVTQFLLDAVSELARADWPAAARRFNGWSVEKLARLPADCGGTRFLPPNSGDIRSGEQLQCWEHRDQLGGYLCRVLIPTDASPLYFADICLTRRADGGFDGELIGILRADDR